MFPTREADEAAHSGYKGTDTLLTPLFELVCEYWELWQAAFRAGQALRCCIIALKRGLHWPNHDQVFLALHR